MVKHKLIGYGSLLSHKSFHTEATNTRVIGPVIVKGYKRIFNISETKAGDSDVLNLKKSKGSEFNGLLFEVDDEELERLSIREEGYNLEEVECYDFKTGKELGKAITCIDYYILIDRKKGLPERSYFILCREAAYQISQSFGKKWDETTFTSTGEKIAEWIKKHKDYDTIKS